MSRYSNLVAWVVVAAFCAAFWYGVVVFAEALWGAL